MIYYGPLISDLKAWSEAVRQSNPGRWFRIWRPRAKGRAGGGADRRNRRSAAAARRRKPNSAFPWRIRAGLGS